MARNRTIYQSEGIAVSRSATATGTGAHVFLRRVQNFGSSQEITRENINQFGQLDRIGTAVLTTPNVSADLSYYLTDGFNERALGFYVQDPTVYTDQVTFPSGHMVSSSGINLYEIIASEGIDLNQESSLSGKAVKGLGNCFISNYSLSAAVGQFPTVSVSIEGLNSSMDVYYAQGAITGTNTPAINTTNGTPLTQNSGVRFPAPSEGTGVNIPLALRPGDISINFSSLTGLSSTKSSSFFNLDTSSADSFHVQSVDLSLPLSRTPIERLGSRFAYARPVDFPITASLSVSAIANETVKRNLASMLDDTSTNEITLTINQPDGSSAMVYTLRGCTYDSENSSLDLGGNKSVDLTFTTQIGGLNSSNGVFVSGIVESEVFTESI